MWLLRRLVHSAALGLAALLALGGCASTVRQAPPSSAEPALRGSLLVVRLLDLMEPPPAVRIDVALPSDTAGTTVSARLQQSLPGRYADYLVALALPPDRYVLKAVRTAGTAEAADAPRLLASLNVPFEVKAAEPGYLGRLLMPSADAPAGARVTVEDHFEEDTVLFRTAVEALKTTDITRDVIPAEALVTASLPAPAPAPAEAAGARMEVAPVTPATAELLPAGAQQAFERFLRLKPPRAFAAGDTGGYGYANGARAVERALRACARRSGKQPCRLFAVDDTLITENSCQATLQGSRKDAPIEPGCAEAPPNPPGIPGEPGTPAEPGVSTASAASGSSAAPGTKPP